MSLIIRIALCLFAASVVAGCSSAKPLVKQPPEWGYEKDGILLHLVGDPQLNLYQKKSHSLIVCLYQLRDPNAFQQLVNEKDGLSRLLECSRFDPSVTYSRRLVLQPNQELLEAQDRTDGARFVGLVAGYYALDKEGSVRFFPVPVTGKRTGSTLVQKAAKLNVELYLGRLEIRQPEQAGQSHGTRGE